VTFGEHFINTLCEMRSNHISTNAVNFWHYFIRT